MKIVYIIDHLRPDGAQTALSLLVSGLSKKGHQQAVVCLNDSFDQAVVDGLRQYGAKVVVTGKARLLLLYGLVELWIFLWREKFDAAVTWPFFADILGKMLSRAAKIRWIVTAIRTRDEFYHGWQRWLERRTMHWADLIVVNSKYFIDFVTSEEGAHPEKIRVIHNFVDVGKYSRQHHKDLMRELGVPENGFLVGSVGRLIHQKGMDILIKALSLVENEQVYLIIAGVGEEQANLANLVHKLGLDDRVHFLGFRKDIAWVLAGLDLYVHASRYEGMPNAILEAMAAGKPIVATAVDGTRELIVSGMHGWLVPPNNPAAIAVHIKKALSEPEQAKRMGIAARQRAEQAFSEERIIRQWETALNGLPSPGD